MKLTIEKLIYGGDGLGRLPADEQGRGKAVFVPFVLPSEEIEAALIEERPGFARARVEQIVSPAPQRAVPPCPYFGRCGGCHYQHTSYEHQLEIKSEILRETYQRAVKHPLEVPLQVHSGEPWAYRNRTRMKVRSGKGDFALGYYAFGSHDLLPVEECPISSGLINRAIDVLWEVAEGTRVPEALREVQFFANDTDTSLLVEFYIERNAEPKTFKRFAEALRAAMPSIVGVAVFPSAAGHEGDNERAPLASEATGSQTSFGANVLAYKVGDVEYEVSAGAFFQTNRFLAPKLVELVTRQRSGGAALDLYAGAGLFTVPLAKTFERVIGVEAAPYSSADLKRNAPRNAKAVRSSTEEYLRKLPASSRFDLVVVDPPRAGLGEKTARMLGKLNTSQVTYVSCDPSTLSRDLKILLECGFRVEQAHLVDLFPQTFHMESVFQLVR